MFHSPQVTIYSRDLPRSVAFYAAVGFEAGFRYPREGATEHVELLLDGFNLDVATVETAVSNHRLSPMVGGGGMELVVWTDDTNAAFERLIELGATPLSAPHDWLDSLRLAWVADPDGNPIQLAQRR